MVNKLVISSVLAALILSGTAFYRTLRFGTQVDNKNILEIKKKFGENPSEPLYNPIIKLADKKGKAFCSAFVIDANYAVTAGHCVGGIEDELNKEDLRVILDSGQDAGIKVKAMGYTHRVDLGLIMGNFNKFKPLRADFINFRSNVPVVMACGFPFCQKQLICNPILPQKNDVFYVDAMGYMVPGMSGGPVIDVKTGEAIGLNSASGEGVVKFTPLQGLLGAFHGLE